MFYISFPSAAHKEVFLLGLDVCKKKYGQPTDEKMYVHLFYQAARYTYERFPDELTYDVMIGLLTVWQRDYCGIGADLTENTLTLH
jgi:hypothetical protein